MTTMHPTCTELASWQAADTDSALGRHLTGCSRCRGLQALLEAEGAELERLVPAAELLKELEDLTGSEAASVPASPANVALAASVRSACRARLAAGVEQLDLDAPRGLLWRRGAGGDLPLGDQSDLRGYLEGLWLEEWSAAALPALDAGTEAAMAADIDATVAALQPRLERSGWVARRPARSLASRLSSVGQMPLRKKAWQAAFLAAPLAGLLLLWSKGLLSPQGESLAGPESASGALSGVAPQQASPDRVAKGTKGVPPVVVVIKRGETLLEYEGHAVILPGDRLRLRFHLDQAGPVLAGILTASGQWVTFFDERFATGDHSPRATLSVDDRPSSGRILLGEPSAVRAAVSGGGEAGLHVIELVWKPAFSANPWEL